MGSSPILATYSPPSLSREGGLFAWYANPMAEVIVIMYAGLFVVGPPSDEECMTAVHDWLIAKGWAEEDLINALANRFPQLAWYCEEFGFVYETHPCAIQGAIIQVNDNYLLGPE